MSERVARFTARLPEQDEARHDTGARCGASIAGRRGRRATPLPSPARGGDPLHRVQDILPFLIALLAVTALGHLLAPRLGAPAPVLLALAGALLGFIPGVPHVELDPDLILVLFLPPLLYSDAFNTSWVDFRRWFRPILSLAVGLVVLTIVVVGLLTHALLPGLPLAACFILGAIVSPTDTVAVQAVIERLRIPRRATAILGGESLVNDATGLVGVQLGVAVVVSGAFSLRAIGSEFLLVAGLGVLIGLAVGALFAAANRRVRDAQVLFVLSLLSPYLAYLVAARAGASGVLAVVVAGFVVAWRIHQVPPEARVQLYATWTMLTYVLNGMCFLFIGLETPHLLATLDGAMAGGTILRAGLLIGGAVIAARIAWCLPFAYLPLLFMPRLRAREGGYPPFRNVLLVSWCGARGVVSLAAALALPHTLDDDSSFPGRVEIIACTLCVILVTLIGQGLTLHPLIRLLRIRDDDTTAAEERAAREQLLTAGIARLDAFCSETSCPLSVHHWRAQMADELLALRSEDAEERRHAHARLAVTADVQQAVADAQDEALLCLRDRGTINDKTYMALQLERDRGGRAGSRATA